MTETFAVILCAHVLADFVFQTDAMAAKKAGRDARAMALHIGTVWLTATVAVGQLHPAIFALALVHLAVDTAKTFAPRGLAAFLADQAAHLVTLALVAAVVPGLWTGGWWPALVPAPLAAGLPAALAIVAGAIIATRAGGFVLDMLVATLPRATPKPSEAKAATVARFEPDPATEGLPNAGRLIGLLERGLIFLLVLANQAAAVGFLIAAKSVLRFGSVKDDRAASEYVIIGTLASFGWALAAAFATTALLTALGAPLPLGFPPARP